MADALRQRFVLAGVTAAVGQQLLMQRLASNTKVTPVCALSDCVVHHR